MFLNLKSPVFPLFPIKRKTEIPDSTQLNNIKKGVIKMKKIIMLLILTVFIISTTIADNVFTHQTASLELSFPDHWVINTEDEILEAYSPDSLINMFFIILESSDLEEGINEINQQLVNELGEITIISEEEEFTINGMPAYELTGSFQIDDVEQNISLDLIITPSARVMAIYSIYLPDSIEKYKDDLSFIINHLKPISSEEEPEEEYEE